MHFDVFNGDADGIIALVQLRLSEPKESHLITGVKRDISLLKQVDLDVATSVTVLDVSMEKNTEALTAILNNNIDVLYVDHHRAGEMPVHKKLTAIINTDANTCTSLLVNSRLQNQFAKWAVAAAFGDNMNQSAEQLATHIGLSAQQQEQLKALGIYINYNGYGASLDDLHFHPAALFQHLVKYDDPLTLIAEPNSIYHQLSAAYQADMDLAQSALVLADTDVCKVVQLANEPWARRVSGVFGNEMANQTPNKAHAVLTQNADATFTVSVRAPLNNKQGADEVCIQFATGGGRAGAAGINALPADEVSRFIDVLNQYYQA